MGDLLFALANLARRSASSPKRRCGRRTTSSREGSTSWSGGSLPPAVAAEHEPRCDGSRVGPHQGRRGPGAGLAPPAGTSAALQRTSECPHARRRSSRSPRHRRRFGAAPYRLPGSGPTRRPPRPSHDPPSALPRPAASQPGRAGCSTTRFRDAELSAGGRAPARGAPPASAPRPADVTGSRIETPPYLSSSTSESSFLTRWRSQSGGGGCHTATATPPIDMVSPPRSVRHDAPDRSALRRSAASSASEGTGMPSRFRAA